MNWQLMVSSPKEDLHLLIACNKGADLLSPIKD